MESIGAQVMHFTTQFGAFETDIPSIYQPHDLQHLHLPGSFRPEEIEVRERVYRAACAQASAVLAMTSWGRDDLISRYNLPPEKVHVVPWAPVLPLYPEPTPDDLPRVRAKWRIPESFILYPAQTWPHKNHLRLVRALGLLRKRGVNMPIVCTGHRTAHHAEVMREARRQGVADLLVFTGFVAPGELRTLYRLSRGLVFPSLFEGWGMPVLEAFAESVPVACATSTVLPELAGHAARLFDPMDEEAIADALAELWSNDDLRRRLIEGGRVRAQTFSWEATARRMRSHYRRVADLPLSEEDRDWLRRAAPI